MTRRAMPPAAPKPELSSAWRREMDRLEREEAIRTNCTAQRIARAEAKRERKQAKRQEGR